MHTPPLTHAHIGAILEAWAPPSLAESYDNVGLLVGEPDAETTGVLCTLDVTDAILDEALQLGANLIVAHHPAWFGKRYTLTPQDPAGRVLYKAIQLGIGLYGLHTNLDNVRTGVNHMLADRLELQERRILAPKSGQLLSLSVTVPTTAAHVLLEALQDACAGLLDDSYLHGAQTSNATDHFTPLPGSQPHTGAVGEHQSVDSTIITVTLPAHAQGAVLRALFQAHPYEQPAYQLTALQNAWPQVGSGMIGQLPAPMAKEAFIEHVKTQFNTGCVRWADAPTKAQVQRVALCGGSGSFLISRALAAGADAFITADVTYHTFFEPDGRMLLLDVGHYESEQFVPAGIARYLSEKLPNFAVHLSGVSTNPLHYS